MSWFLSLLVSEGLMEWCVFLLTVLIYFGEILTVIYDYMQKPSYVERLQRNLETWPVPEHAPAYMTVFRARTHEVVDWKREGF